MVLTAKLKGSKEDIENAIFNLQWRGFDVKKVEEGDGYTIIEIRNAFLRSREGLLSEKVKKKLDSIEKKLEKIWNEVRKINIGESGGFFIVLLLNTIELAIDVCRIAHMIDSFVRMETLDISEGESNETTR